MKCLGNELNRRGFLHVGLLGGLGLTLADYLRMEAAADQKFFESKEGTAKSVIFATNFLSSRPPPNIQPARTI